MRWKAIGDMRPGGIAGNGTTGAAGAAGVNGTDVNAARANVHPTAPDAPVAVQTGDSVPAPGAILYARALAPPAAAVAVHPDGCAPDDGLVAASMSQTPTARPLPSFIVTDSGGDVVRPLVAVVEAELSNWTIPENSSTDTRQNRELAPPEAAMVTDVTDFAFRQYATKSASIRLAT